MYNVYGQVLGGGCSVVSFDDTLKDSMLKQHLVES